MDKCIKCSSNKLCGSCYRVIYEKLLDWLNSKDFKEKYLK